MDSASFGAQVRAAIDDSRARVASFKETEQAFGPTIRAYDSLTHGLNGLSGRVSLFSNVHPDKEMRDLCETLQQEISKLGTELSLDRGLFDRLDAVKPDGASEDETRLWEHAVRDFRRAGVDRDEATREKISALREELVKIGQRFDKNIIQGGREYVVENGHAGLAGLPQDFLDSHPEAEDGTCVLSSDPADRMAVLTYAEDSALRHAYYVRVMSRAFPENEPVLKELIAKRHELAQLLGYATYADFVTETKMTKTPGTTRSFVDRVIDSVRDRAATEIEELKAVKRQNELDEPDVIREWERSFLSESLRRERFSFDSQAVRPYFAYDRVRDGVLAVSERLYGVKFQRRDDLELWHEAVEAYDVVDDGQVVARFYLDMHARENKFKHAAMFHVSEGVVGDEPVLAEAALVCNFPEPKRENGELVDPALMLHDQVTTYFHEFGHLLHHLFGGRQRLRAFSGIATEYDFVEVPSQMYEEWAWDTDVLQTFAKHHETDEPIPAELVEKMRAAEEYGKGIQALVQMSYADLSLETYRRDPASFDVFDLAIERKGRLLPFPHTEGNQFVASFGHLNGYSAIYYTYMWSLVIAKDVFSRFESDLMNTDTANEYRAKVLAPGGSKDAKDLVRDFLGREYDYGAFEAWLAR